MKSWFSNAIIYHIFIDRFAGYRENSDASKPEFCGGNIRGIINKIGYFKELGVNTIWISPFYKTSAYHGYHITDFDSVDERYGTIEDLKELIGRCHENSLKIIADIVPNHCSDKHPWFTDAVKNKNSDYYKWFYFKEWPHSYLRFLEFDDLPKINLENPDTSKSMIKSLTKWAKLGFDGYRIDHILGVPDPFLRTLRKELLAVNSDFILIGEAWSEGIRHKHLKTLKFRGKTKLWNKKLDQLAIQKHYSGIIDGVLDFGWRQLVIQNINQVKKDIATFKKIEHRYNNKTQNDLILTRFLDNHDTSRIMFSCNNDEKLFKSLLQILAEQEQPIILYNGTEYGLSHNSPVNPEIPYADLQARDLLPWHTKPKYADYIGEMLKKRRVR